VSFYVTIIGGILMKILSKTLIFFVPLILGIATSTHLTRDCLAYIPKIKIPIDYRPFPKTAADWKKIQKMPDPLEENASKTTCLFMNAKNVSIPWHKLGWGDIILGRGAGKNSIPYGYFRHTGMWNYDKKQLLSAMPGEGVIYQTQTYWTKKYPRLEFLTVMKLNLATKKIISLYGEKQLGKPYKFSSKSTATSWYCSKLPWACYNGKNVDLDAYNTHFVAPDNLYYSNHTKSIFRKE
jgi:hypothetical protein